MCMIGELYQKLMEKLVTEAVLVGLYIGGIDDVDEQYDRCADMVLNSMINLAKF